MRRKNKRPNRIPMMICLIMTMIISTAFTANHMYFNDENIIENQSIQPQYTQFDIDEDINLSTIHKDIVFMSSNITHDSYLKFLMNSNTIPETFTNQIYGYDTIYEEETKIPESKQPVEEEEIIESEPSNTIEDVKIHVIKTGDSYWDIAVKYYGRGNYCYAMAEYNGITTNTILHNGDELIIPSLDDPEFQKLITGITYTSNPTSESVELSYSDSNEYKYGKRMKPAVDINIPGEGESMKNYTGDVDTSNFTYWGECKITGYTPGCAHCCGGSTAGIGASGVSCIPGYSVAMGSAMPFGTTIYIEGYGFYVVEDRGVGNYHVDISAPNHDACYDLTKLGVNVWIVE